VPSPRGQFLTTPSVRKVSEAKWGRSIWQTEGALIFGSSTGETFHVPAGYRTDFASVPRVPLAYLLTGDSAHMSAILHDWLCTDLYPHVMTWKEAADIFREAMGAEGVPAWRAWVMYWAVRLFGEVKA
jgi:hypothetical protein